MRRGLWLVLALSVLGAACGSGGSDAAGDATTSEIDVTITLDLADGELVDGVRREAVSLGDTVLVRVVGDVSEQVHVHGYDLYIEPDGDRSLQFEALIPGRFEIELEQSGQLLIELTVS